MKNLILKNLSKNSTELCLVLLVDDMEVDPDTLQSWRSAGVEPRLLGSHHGHLQPRHGVAPVVREPLPGEVGGQQRLR